MVSKVVRLVINIQPFYGSTKCLGEYKTYKEAAAVAVAYRDANPNAYTMEIYDHVNGGHDMEDYNFWKEIASR